jgi:hypothetical protein
MTKIDGDKTVTLQELMVSTLAMVDAVSKLLIEKGVISEEEFGEALGGTGNLSNSSIRPRNEHEIRGSNSSSPGLPLVELKRSAQRFCCLIGLG